MLSDWRPFVFGGLSSICAEFGTFPIDTTKTRLQVQGQVGDAAFKEIKYRGMVHALIRITREEGLAALYAGVKPALLRQATYGALKIGLYHYLKGVLIGSTHEETLAKTVACGVVAGSVAASLATPTDVLKVRLQSHQGAYSSQSGMMQCFMHIHRTEGLRGLWKGMCLTGQRAAVCAGVELSVYDFCKRHLVERMGDTTVCHLGSSFVAGLSGAVASTPIDVVRTRLMNQKKLRKVDGARLPVLYTGSFHCAIHTVRTEGPAALYRGFVPTWVRLGPWNMIFFTLYEQMKRLN